MIKTQNLCKSFGNSPILEDISTEFEHGKVNLIIGKSGSGKTVLLKCLLGLYPPTSGEIYYDQTLSTQMEEEDQSTLRSKIGMVFQGSALFDYMSVKQNVGFPLDMYTTMSKAEKKQRVEEVLEQVDLAHVGDKFPSETSGGMQKRAAIARAIVNHPQYLFCDEPNSGLDPSTSILIDQLLLKITKTYNTTTIINTHDMNSVLEIGQKIIYLKSGKLHWEGSNQSLLNAGNTEIQDFIFSSKLLKSMLNQGRNLG
ncbi:MAG: ABC transporter ATP-binding protein [Flavobacteriaceae bacterium]|nr:MAG: ABC transporter ATP-binding protein [Flavobacteriaceae bacterium]